MNIFFHPQYADSIAPAGGLNHNELNNILSPIFSPPDPLLASKIESLHNQLICAILSNIGRDMPDPGVASWVSANDKPAAAPKPVSGDAAEQRVKTEVKNLPAKDRRRIKTAGTAEGGIDGVGGSTKQGAIDMGEMQTARGMKLRKQYEDYNREKTIKLPDVTPASAGGVTKTSELNLTPQALMFQFTKEKLERNKADPKFLIRLGPRDSQALYSTSLLRDGRISFRALYNPFPDSADMLRRIHSKWLHTSRGRVRRHRYRIVR